MSIHLHPALRQLGALGLCVAMVAGMARGVTPGSAAHAPGLSQIRNRVIILMRDGAPQDGVARALRLGQATNVYQYQRVNAIAAKVTPQMEEALEQSPEVQSVFPDRQVPMPTMSVLDQANAALQFVRAQAASNPVLPEAIRITHATDVQQTGDTGQGVKVAVINSGIDTSNPDLAGTLALAGNGQPLAADFTSTDLTDTVGHGTACASEIAAQGAVLRVVTNTVTGITTTIKMVGMAPGVKLLSAKIFDTRVASGYNSQIMRAIEWSLDHGANILSEFVGWAEHTAGRPGWHGARKFGRGQGGRVRGRGHGQ